MTAGSRWRAVGLAAALVVAAPTFSAAQYFGRNKVQYRTFAFEVLKTEHFDVYFYAEERAAAAEAARMAERWYARLARVLQHQLVDRQPLMLYASHPDFEQTNAIEGELGEGTGGVTEMLKRRIVLPLGGPLAETDHVIGHELVHAFQFDIASFGLSRGTGRGLTAIEQLPLWFIEGMAEYLSIGPVDANTAMWMRDAASQERMPSIRDLNSSRYFPYRWGQSLWAYVTGRWGDEVVAPLLRNAAANGNAEIALTTVLGVSAEQLTTDWHQALRQAAAGVRQQTRRVTDYGAVLERDTSELTGLNVSPSLSPDGRRMMFLSQRDLVSIDLFLADAVTGRIIRKVVNTAVDPHFSSLQFIRSAGTWSPDGRRFAFPVVHAGRPALVLVSVDGHLIEREIPFPDLGEVFNPAWSPDGRSIAFAALVGGLTDLYLLDLVTGKARRLTADAYADLQPAWSPDGRTLAFATDRYSTNLADLAIGDYQIALMEVATGAIRPVEGAAAGKNINPQWTADGGLLFVSDRGGISNIYRVPASGGPVTQITRLSTGVSGITASSPAISFAPAADRLAFSVYENEKFSIFAIDRAAILAGAEPVALDGPNPAALPPERRSDGQVTRLQSTPTFGLPAAGTGTTSPYRARLGLDLVGQPYATVGVNPYGTYAGGGVALFWSDMMGDHNLGAAVQVSSGFGGGLGDILRNTGAQVAYQDRKRRWNWAVTGGQMPYTTGDYAIGETTIDGNVVGVEQQTIYRQVERSASFLVARPFNRADRLELSAGFANISFDKQVLTTLYDPATGNAIAAQTTTVPTALPLNLGQFGAALVHDTSLFGATSPVAGESWRLQASPTAGTIEFTSVLADYRRYLMPVPFYTVALRALHYGRYGRDAEDQRLVPLFIGYPNLVRGYDLNTFNANECRATAVSSCPELDRLFGSRMLVANIELRFPLRRPFGVNQRMYGPVPIEVGVFADAGVAWNSGQKPQLFGGLRHGVSSAGVTVRANLFGVVVGQFDAARPFQRPGRGWVFSFNLVPGF
jgi:Tol biopolymer transport system component